MKQTTKLFHNLVLKTRLDKPIARWSKALPVLKKFIPTNKEYVQSTVYRVLRSGALFDLEMRDYMQWHVFANIPEPLWEKGWNRLQRGAVIFDIGANIGAFSIKTSTLLSNKSLEHTIYGFEPNIEICEKFQHNVELNPRIKSKVKTCPIALSKESGKLYFEFGKENSGGGKLTDKPTDHLVEVTTLDDFMSRKELDRLDLLKIDVEGFEPLVITGAMSTIKKYHPDLLIEVTDEWFKSNGFSAIQVMETLFEFGYKLHLDYLNIEINHETLRNMKDFPFQFNIFAFHESRK